MNGNYDHMTEIDVERLMAEIDRRAERERRSLPGAALETARDKPAQDTVEQRLNDALDAQLALNASLVDSLERLAQRLEHAYREAHLFQERLAEKMAHTDEAHAGLAQEVARLRDELCELTERTRQLKGSMFGLMRVVKKMGQADELPERVLVLEETVHELAALQEKMRTGRAEQAEFFARQATSDEMLDYFLFEHRFRGSREEIRERQSIYLDLFRDRHHVLDLGCGRGEFLELLTEQEVAATGIDVNPDMVNFCRGRGLNVVQADAFEYLHNCQDEPFDGIFSAQVVEHLPPMEVVRLLALCATSLRPGGLLVVETTNAECPIALGRFFVDPTHVRPIPADLLAFIAEQCSLKVTDVKYSSPVDDALPFVFDPAQQARSQTSRYQDYAVVAVK